MSASMAANEFDVQLDVLSQQPFLNVYTQLCLIFSIDDSLRNQGTIDLLNSGLERLSANFPWITGQIVNEGSTDFNTGVFKIRPFRRQSSLVVQDLRSDTTIPSMDVMRQTGFPTLPDEGMIAPRKTFPESSEDLMLEHLPVFALQANFIQGGMILTSVGHHQAMDLIGQSHMMSLLSKACRREEYTAVDIVIGNSGRLSQIPWLTPDSDLQAILARQLVPASSKPGNSPSTQLILGCDWYIFTFSSTSLLALKAVVREDITDPPGYVSTDDVLSAFIWRAIMRARQARMHQGVEISLDRAVDVRRHFGLPPAYPVMMQNCIYHTYPLEDLLLQPLGVIASHLRKAIDPKISDVTNKTRALATYLEQLSYKRGVSYAATLDLTKDVMISSWAKAEVYGFDFGLDLGKPEAVRRPQFPPYEGLVYLLPKR